MSQPVDALAVLGVQHYIRGRLHQQLINVQFVRRRGIRDGSGDGGPDPVGSRYTSAAGERERFQELPGRRRASREPGDRRSEQGPVIAAQECLKLVPEPGQQQRGPGDDLVHGQPRKEPRPCRPFPFSLPPGLRPGEAVHKLKSPLGPV